LAIVKEILNAVLLKLQINPTNYIVLCEINSLSAPKLIKIVIEQIQRYENNKL